MELLSKAERERAMKQRAKHHTHTDLAIREAFLKQLRRHPIEEIRVGELCEACGINRSTFYRRCGDLPTLLETIVEECHQALFYDVVEKVDLSEEFDQVGYQYILGVCQATEQDKELYKLLLFGKTPTTLRQRMVDSALELYILAHTGPTLLKPSKQAGLHYQFLVHGMIGVWAAWVQDDCRTPKEEVANAIRQDISGFYATLWDLFSGSPPRGKGPKG